MTPRFRAVAAVLSLASFVVGMGQVLAAGQAPADDAAGGAAMKAAALNPGTFRVTDFGAIGDGETKNTGAIQRAIDTAAGLGGGTVYVPPGRYLSGSLTLKSGVTLHLERGATLLGSTELTDYPPHNPQFRSYTDNYVCQSLLFGENVHDVAITGDGTIDGQGASFKAEKPDWGYRARPYLIRLVTSQHIRVEGITLRDSPMWVQHYLACDHVNLRGVTVQSRVNHNNDGVNIDCCRHVRISDCSISSGDDAIVLKSTADRATENVTVSNCVLSSACNGLKLGTESNGGFKNITMTGCALYDVNLAGIALEMVDGGVLDGVIVSGITMQNVGGAIFLRLGNRARPFKAEMDKPGMGALRNVIIDNVIGTGIGNTGSSITGLPGHPIGNVSLSRIKLTYAGGGEKPDSDREVPEHPEAYPEFKMFGGLPAYGFYCRHVDGLTFADVDVRCEKADLRSAIVCDDVRRLEIDGLKAQARPKGAPTIVLEDTRAAMVRGCRAEAGTSTFIHLKGEAANVSLIGNDLAAAGKPFELDVSVPRNALYHAANRGLRRARPGAASGWQPLFDGRTLTGWHTHGEPDVWRVENGELIGELVRQSPYAYLVTDNRFGDFELRLQMLFESEDGNSGVFFRCAFPPHCAKCNHVARELPEDAADFKCPECGHGEALPYKERVHIHGPQTEFAPQNTGGLYDAGGGGWINQDVLTEEVQKLHRFHEWNELALKVVGDHMTVHVNGTLVSDVKDHPLAPKGIIALQLHAGGPMKVRFRDIRIRPATE